MYKKADKTLIEGLYEMYDWNDDYYISSDNKYVMEVFEEYCGSHSFTRKERVREATEKDIEVNKMLRVIKKDLFDYMWS